MLSLQNISVQAGQKKLLRTVNFKVKKGEVVILLGGNGAGKSTLLKTAAGSIAPHTGDIQLHQQALKDWKADELATNRAVLSQNISLTFPLQTIDLVGLGRYPYYRQGKPSHRDQQIIQEAMQLLGIADKAQQNILELSGGEQQRAHIARVLAQVWESTPQNPKLLLLDEPTSNLDISYQHILLKHLRQKAHKKGLASLVVLHDINLAAQYASKIALLKKGQLLIVDTPDKTLTPHWIKKAFDVPAVIQQHPVLKCIQVSTY